MYTGKKSKGSKILILLKDILLITPAIVASFVVASDILGLKIMNPERIGIATLIFLITLSLSVFLDRKTHLNAIQDTLNRITDTYTFGARYLENKQAVDLELERVVRQADENIMALGGKSRVSNYLNAIEKAVSQRSVIYHRLVNGADIPHELHEHLVKMVKAPNVQIAWTGRENFVPMTVTENECIIILPTPYRDKYSGLSLPGQSNSRRYIHDFFETFFKGIPLRKEKVIEILCEKCSPNTAGDSAKIEKIIEEEIKLFGE